jgi:hypothetical protein
MSSDVPDPVFPPIPASDPVVIPAIPQQDYDQWFPGPIVIRSNADATYDLETIWLLGNAEKLSGQQTNYVLKNITSVSSLAEQLSQEWLDANPEVVTIMPQFLQILVLIGKQLKGPDGKPIL